MTSQTSLIYSINGVRVTIQDGSWRKVFWQVFLAIYFLVIRISCSKCRRITGDKIFSSLGVYHKALETRSQLDITLRHVTTTAPQNLVRFQKCPSIYLLAAITQGSCALDKFTTRLLLHFIKVVEIDSEQEVGQVRLVSTINKLAYHCE